MGWLLQSSGTFGTFRVDVGLKLGLLFLLDVGLIMGAENGIVLSFFSGIF